MEGNLNLLPGGDRSHGDLELQNSVRFNQKQPHTLQPRHKIHSHGRKEPSINHVFTPLTIGTMQDCYNPILRRGYNKDECPKNTTSDEDEPSLTEDVVVDSKYEVNKGKKRSMWKRVKWTDIMVRILITVVSYVGEDAESECGGGGVRMKYAIMQKKGKWKSVSKVMAERDYFVSPQQCEDKFNDLNKRYKRLNDVLGRGISCQVVENPALLDRMDHLSVKVKDDVRKILSSKHLFYEEMCSYHNGNRLHLPPDPALQRSLQLALRSREDDENNEATRLSHDDFDEEEHIEESEDHDPYEKTHAIHGIQRGSEKRAIQGQWFEESSFGNPINLHLQDCHKINQSDPQPSQFAVTKQTSLDGSKASLLKNEWLISCSHELEERKIELQMEMFELEKQRFEWQRINKKKDMELEKMRMENERMKLENERIKLKFKRKGIMSKDCN